MGGHQERDGPVGPYRIEFKHSAWKEFAALPRHVQLRFRDCLEEMVYDPCTARAGLAVRRLHHGTWRLRVGSYRGIYEVSHRRVVFTRFGHRSKVYR